MNSKNPKNNLLTLPYVKGVLFNAILVNISESIYDTGNCFECREKNIWDYRDRIAGPEFDLGSSACRMGGFPIKLPRPTTNIFSQTPKVSNDCRLHEQELNDFEWIKCII